MPTENPLPASEPNTSSATSPRNERASYIQKTPMPGMAAALSRGRLKATSVSSRSPKILVADSFSSGSACFWVTLSMSAVCPACLPVASPTASRLSAGSRSSGPPAMPMLSAWASDPLDTR